MPKPGDFFVTHTNGWIGAFIRKVTLSTVNHAGIFLDETTIVEAETQGARVGNISEYPNADVSTIDLTDAQRATIVNWSRAHIGTPYNFLDIFALLVSRTTKLKIRWVNERLSSNGTLICSQLVDAAYRAAGVKLFKDGRPTGDVTPEDLYVVRDGAPRT